MNITVGPIFGVPAFQGIIVLECTLPTTRNYYRDGGGGRCEVDVFSFVIKNKTELIKAN